MALSSRIQTVKAAGIRKGAAPALPSVARPRSRPLVIASSGLAQSNSLQSRRAALGAAAAVVALAGAGDASASFGTCTPVTAANGLGWCDVEVGTGATPAKGARIRCHYTGRLASNGAVFDSSYERRQPLSFSIGVGMVIKGWDVGILGSEADGIPPMKVGGKRRLIIPAELGYGSRGAGGVIPPNAVLEFDVELVG
eukprot:CAMPEP_0202893448 /NCGR_PEP_ID=MMETSP1392-20130828/3033_1 /ASSEMBLY_ACC=CAM_ASM_000868 /TAXON_ID=225041 /ORGANISM="Chlamydomonas chlamydogama, Strain SAG 11-48b" /LENGTH=196 /DNA_ID=CAMNT_0049577785 /DNA_START=47 /DNA_END=637 /DNA_ORIENTATION=+